MTTGLNSEASTLYSAVNGCRGTHLPRQGPGDIDTEPRARRGKNERLETKKQRSTRVRSTRGYYGERSRYVVLQPFTWTIDKRPIVPRYRCPQHTAHTS